MIKCLRCGSRSEGDRKEVKICPKCGADLFTGEKAEET